MKRLFSNLHQTLKESISRLNVIVNNQFKWEKKLLPFNLRTILLFSLSLITLSMTVVIQNTAFSLLMLVLTLLSIIASLEYEIYSLPVVMNERGKKLKEKTILWMISLKEVFISLLIIIIFLLLTVLILNLLPFKFEGKKSFHITIFVTFFLSLFSYSIYTKNRISQKLLKKFHQIDDSLLQTIEEAGLRKNSLIVTDLLAIAATVFLLSNTTASLVYPVKVNSLDDILPTFEFKSLLLVMAIYIPAIYFRIPK